MRRILAIICVTTLIVGVMLICGACGCKEHSFPEPDAIVVYYEGRQIVLTKGDKDFLKVYALFNAKLPERKLEAFADDEIVNSVKKKFAAEYIYNDAQLIQTKTGTENIARALFFLAENSEGKVAFYRNGYYKSGRVDFSYDRSRIKEIVISYEDDVFTMPKAGWVTAL